MQAISGRKLVIIPCYTFMPPHCSFEWHLYGGAAGKQPAPLVPQMGTAPAHGQDVAGGVVGTALWRTYSETRFVKQNC